MKESQIKAAAKAISDGLHREGDADIRAGLAYLSDEAMERIAAEALAAAMAQPKDGGEA